MFSVVLLGFGGFCFGVLTAAGVFTVLTAVGLVPRFVGETHSAKEIFVYENMIILGTIIGGLFSIFAQDIRISLWMKGFLPENVITVFTIGALGVFGLFAGMFVGCLALAIAEMLDSIPIFTRRVSLRHGLGILVFSIALGKLCGSLYYFINNMGMA